MLLTSFRARTCALMFAAALCGSLPVSHVRAQAAVAAETNAPAPSRADELFRNGKEKLAAQDFAQACPMLAESFQRDPATGTLLALALCHERAGEIANAHREYLEAAERSKQEGRADREQVARARAAALEPQLAKPEVVVASAPSVVQEPAPKAASWRAEPPPGRSTGLTAWQWVGIGTAGAGVVSFAIATGLAVHAVSKNDDSDSGCDGDLCTAAARQDRLDARTAGDGASLGLLIGSALVTTGAAIFFSTGSHEASGSSYALTPWVAPRAAGTTLRGSF